VRKQKTYPMFSDDVLAIFDNALSAAETELQILLPRMSVENIADSFAAHVSVHLETELRGAKKYDNDVEAFRDAVNEGTESAF
jgi:hypothetical protein